MGVIQLDMLELKKFKHEEATLCAIGVRPSELDQI